jgi:hypothetical protein
MREGCGVDPSYPAKPAPFWAARLVYGRLAVVVLIVLPGPGFLIEFDRHGPSSAASRMTCSMSGRRRRRVGCAIRSYGP